VVDKATAMICVVLKMIKWLEEEGQDRRALSYLYHVMQISCPWKKGYFAFSMHPEEIFP